MIQFLIIDDVVSRTTLKNHLTSMFPGSNVIEAPN